MATVDKLEQSLASAKGLASDLKTFSLDTNNKEAQQTFNQLATNAENMAQTLQNRLNFVLNEEPQYKNQN
ncbi:MAG: DUF1657 domain-containing protein [Eubacteriales bacterium]